jgi:hypothetical protein
MNDADHAARVHVLELKDIRNALYAIDAAVHGMDCNDLGAQEGVRAWILDTAHKLAVMVKEQDGEEPEGKQ